MYSQYLGRGLFSLIFLLSSVSAFNIKITEVFFEGAQEWIELTNFDTFDFGGNLSFSGLKSSVFHLTNITIPGTTSVIVGDNLTGIIDTSGAIKTGAGLSLPDNGAIDIRMFSGNDLLDRFAVDSGLVLPYIDGRTSFERVWYAGELKITPATSGRVANVLSGIVANPGSVFTVAVPVVILDLSGSIVTGTVYTGTTLTGNVITGSCSFSLTGILMISEIHPSDSRFGNYVELVAGEAIYQTITLSGGSTTSSFHISLKAGERLIIADETRNLINISQIIINSQVSSFLTGPLVILGQSGQVLDSIIQGVYVSSKSLYRANYDGCSTTMSTSSDPTPGFDERILNLLPSASVCPTPAPVSCSCNCPTAPSCPLGASTGSVVSTGVVPIAFSGFNSGILFSGMFQSLLDQLSLQCLLFTSGGILTGKQCLPKVIKSSTKSGSALSTPKPPKNPKPPKVTKPKLPKKSLSNISSSSSSTPQQLLGFVELVDIQADPDGSDRGREIITLLLVSGSTQDLKGRTLRRNTSKRSLSGLLYAGVPLTLTGSFSFPNNGACIELRTPGGDVQDMICYESSVDEELLFGEDDSVEYSGSGENNILPDITITMLVPNPAGIDKGKEQIGLLYHGTGMLDLKDFKLMVGKRSIRIKGILTGGKEQILQGNYGFPNAFNCVNLMKESHLIDQFCYAKPAQGQIFEDQSSDVHFAPDESLTLQDIKLSLIGNQRCLKVKGVIFQCKALKITSSLESKILKNYVATLKEFMRSEFPILYYRTWMVDDIQLLDQLLALSKAGKIQRTQYDQRIPLEDFDRIARIIHIMALDPFIREIGFRQLVRHSFSSS